ncbi:MAG: exodeoxyribonuclease VII small subunit [Propionibacteriaceae bacterium]|jgi:exodeoxyribonuclease VII small subunit|nr:exodeoxyribonuclease VII small subunit [Propionibacteriaceae bacterium]
MPKRDAAEPAPGAADAAGTPAADLAGVSYERARDDLMSVVRQLESGTATLAQSIELWQRGEKLAAHCQQLLNAARATVAEAVGLPSAPLAAEDDED